MGQSDDGKILFLDPLVTDKAFGEGNPTYGRQTRPGISVFFTPTVDVVGRNDPAEATTETAGGNTCTTTSAAFQLGTVSQRTCTTCTTCGRRCAICARYWPRCTTRCAT